MLPKYEPFTRASEEQEQRTDRHKTDIAAIRNIFDFFIVFFSFHNAVF